MIITTATKIEVPSIQPFLIPSEAIPRTNDITAAAHKTRSIKSSKLSRISCHKVFFGLVIGLLSPKNALLFSYESALSCVPFLRLVCKVSAIPSSFPQDLIISIDLPSLILS